MFRTLLRGCCCFTLYGLVLFSVSQPATARDADGSTDKPEQTYEKIVLADAPVAYWRFDEGNLRSSGTAASLQGKITGNVRLNRPGPRTERFPLFRNDNNAIAFDGKNGFLAVDDPGADSPLDFHKGDTLTLEAWVNLESLAGGRYAYIVGKGRTGNKGFASENQNYALRLSAEGSAACLSFLFRNERNRAGNSEDFHRWTSKSGISPGSGWHHVAVSYQFGKKNGIRGYIDGKVVAGKWDMGGASEDAPVVDDDQLRIGASRAGSGGIPFHGSIDEVAVYRKVLSAERIRARYKAIPPQPYITTIPLPRDGVLVEIQEKIPANESWDFIPPKPVERYEEPAFAFVEVPHKYSDRGLRIERSNPFIVRASARVNLPAGKYQFLVRSRSASRLFLDGKLLAETPFSRYSGDSHQHVKDLSRVRDPDLRKLQTGDHEEVASFTSPGGPHRFRFEIFVGGKNQRAELGESVTAIRREGQKTFHLLSPAEQVPLTEEGWYAYLLKRREALARLNQSHRQKAATGEREYWRKRHELARAIVSQSPAPQIPDVKNSSSIHNEIDRFLNHKLEGTGRKPGALIGNEEFLRRVCLDTIGTIPSSEQINAFLNDPSPDRRSRLIERLLEHPGWADHWVANWQDVLAENPSILKPTLNNTGPFRWWIHEAFEDNRSFDRFATELILMEGSNYLGAPAGFAMATQNDVPMAAKAHVVGQAFLGLQMKCARCHDAPFHDFQQRDLFSLAAMLKRSAQPVPKTSSIPLSEEAIESLLVTVTLKPGSSVKPHWSFPEISPNELPEGILRKPGDSREKLAALVTSPSNKRFAKVIVNRLWQRYFGRGIVEPVDDWEYPEPSHPELLDYLAREFVLHDYDLKHIARLILNSHAYQRQAVGEESIPRDKSFLFSAPLRRRLTAEQLVDSLFVASGKSFNAGPLNMDLDGSRPYSTFLNLGEPSRSWHFASLSNERDRPSLAMPYSQDFVSLLKAFGWRAARQDPRTVREHEPSVLQPAVVANGVVGRRVTRLSDDSAFTELALEKQPLEKLVERVYLRMLTRHPTEEEKKVFVELLRDGYAERRIDVDPALVKRRFPRLTGVSWSNHLSPEANRIKIEMEQQVQQGDPPSVRLQTDWRERMEDMIWALMNSPEFVFVP